MKRFLRPTGQILTTAVFTSASLNCGYLTARADETQSQPEATASVVDTVPSMAAAPANAPAVAPPEPSPVQSTPAPATSVTVRTETPKHSKEEAPVPSYVVPTEPAIADPSPEPTPTPAASSPPVPSANQPTEEGNEDGTASATNPNSSPASQTSNPTAAAATAPAGQATANSSSKPSATAAHPSADHSNGNPAKAAKRSFVIDSLVSAARRQAEAGNFQQAYLIAQDPMLPRDVQASLQAEIRQLEAAAQSTVASADSSNSKKAGVTAARPTASIAQVGSENPNQASETVPTNAIAETMIASARRQAQAGAFQQAYLIAQDPMLPLHIQQRLYTEIRQLEISRQSAATTSSPAESATGSATESPDSTPADLTELENRETAIADTLIAAAQQQAQDGNFAQAYLIAQDSTLPIELQAALQADIQELEAAATSENTANAANTAETATENRADSTPTATPDKRPLKQQEIAQNLMRIALDYAAAGDIDAANLIAQDPALSVEQQQDLQQQLAELAAQATDSEVASNSTTSTKLNKVAIADAATAEVLPAAEAGAEDAAGDSQTALVPQASFETFGVDQITMNRGRNVNQPLSPLPSIAYLNSAYSAAFSCSQAAAEAVEASPAPTAAAKPVQPAPDAAKIAANRAASLPLNLSLLNRNGLGSADTNLAIDSRFSVPQATYTAPSTLLEADQQPFEHYFAGNATVNPAFDPTLTFKPFDALSFGFENPAGTLRYVASNFGKTAIANLNIFDKIVAVTQSTSQKSELATKKLSPTEAATKALPAPPTDARLVSNRTGGFATFNPNDLSPQTTDCYPVVTSAMGGQVLSTPTFGASGFQFPLSVPAPITSPVGWRIHPISGVPRFHAGTDFGAPTGTPVVAARSGQVAIADYLGGYGATVVIDHPEIGQQTLYAHLSRILVPAGTWVEAGTVIGQVGSTGNSTGPHLHFEVRQQTNRGWVAINPIRLGQ